MGYLGAWVWEYLLLTYIRTNQVDQILLRLFLVRMMPGTQRSFKEKLYCHSLILSCLCRGKQTFWLLCFFLPLLSLLLSPKHSCILFLVPTNFYSFCLSWFLWTSPTFLSCLVLLYCGWVFLCSQADLKLRAPSQPFKCFSPSVHPAPAGFLVFCTFYL